VTKKSGVKGSGRKKKAARKKKGGSDFAISDEQRNEIIAVALLALAVIFLLSLVPVSMFGALADAWFPSGNMLSAVGAVIHGLLTGMLGWSAVLVPILLGIVGLRAGDWLSFPRAVRFGMLAAGLVIIVPIALWTMTGGSMAAAGWLGRTLGGPLVQILGGFGALLVDGVLFVALSIATLRWNPLRSVGQGVVVGGEAAARTARVLADKGKEFAEASAQVLTERDLPGIEVIEAPVEGFEPDWMDGEEDGAPAGDGVDVVDSDPTIPNPDESDADGDTWQEMMEGDSPEAESGDDGREEWPDEHQDALADPNAGTDMEHEVPPVDLLSAPENPDRASMERDLEKLGHVLIEKLGTFNVKSELGGWTTGPVVTQFEVIPAPGVKVNRIANLDADLALAMKARTIRIVAPIPGKGAVGVEIPNPVPEIVNLREILESPAFRKAKGELPLALGKDLNGKPYVSTLEKMPHVLIAGATGAGKSVCLNTIVTSLVFRHTPDGSPTCGTTS
jgi:S-DNA-T family DNA segregation ATPase FtsK/SpoIIIE